MPVFIGYGLKTGQGFYPGPLFFSKIITESLQNDTLFLKRKKAFA